MKYVGADLSTLNFNSSNIKQFHRTMPITKQEALEIGKQFAQAVKEKLDASADIYLFGSAVRGNVHIDSDIDIVVISDVFKQDYITNIGIIYRLAYDISRDIEVHAFDTSQWDKGNVHKIEVKSGGIPL